MTDAVLALWGREIRVFVRDRARVVGVLAQPVLFWLVFGFGFGDSVRIPGSDADYLQYLLPGMIALTVLFTAIYSTLSVAEDRQSGVLQAALVAPQPRSALVLGVVLGGTTLAVGQAALIGLLAPLVGLRPGLAGAFIALAAGVLLAVTFCAFGFVMAWRLRTTRAYHAIMNVVLIPIWLLSGAFFPEAGASGAVALAMRVNPATYGVGLLRYGLEGLPESISGTDLSLPVCLAVSVGAALVALAGAVASAAERGVSPEFVEWVQAYGAWGLCGAAFIGATLVPVSSEAAFVAAIAAGLDSVTALLWASVGNTAGCLVNYALGRGARPWVEKKLAASQAGRAALRWTERVGLPALLLSWLPLVGDPLTLAAGVARVRLAWFVGIVASLRVARYAALLMLT